MASNQHHELAKRVMNQVSDLLVDYTVKQANSFVNVSGIFPKLIKFDYLGKYSLKGATYLLLEAGLEIAADYKYFYTGYTWKDTKQKYYISNFGCYRTNLVPYTDEQFFSKTYELTLKADGEIDDALIRHELVHYFLPYLERLNTLNDLVAFLHWHKPNEDMLTMYRHQSYFYNWLTVIYLLLVDGRSQEAEQALGKVIYVAYSLDRLKPNFRISEGLFRDIEKLQQNFVLSCSYSYDNDLGRISIS